MHELFELPKKTLNLNKEEKLLSKFNIPKTEVNDLEEEVK